MSSTLAFQGCSTASTCFGKSRSESSFEVMNAESVGPSSALAGVSASPAHKLAKASLTLADADEGDEAASDGRDGLAVDCRPLHQPWPLLAERLVMLTDDRRVQHPLDHCPHRPRLGHPSFAMSWRLKIEGRPTDPCVGVSLLSRDDVGAIVVRGSKHLCTVRSSPLLPSVSSD